MLSSFSPAVQVVLLALLGYGCFSAGDALAKFLVGTYSPATCLAYSSLVGLVVSSVWILYAKGWRGFAPPKWKLHLLRGLVIAFSTFMTLNALKRIPLSDFYGIVFLAPISVIILSTLINHERFFAHRLLTAFLGFAGVLIIVGPQYQVMGTGALMALGTVAGVTVSALLMRRIGQGDYLPLYCFFPLLAIFLVNFPAAMAGPNIQNGGQ